MKKTYIKPEIEVVLMKVNTLLMSSGEVEGTGVRMKWTDCANDEGEYGL